jgi:hypothetical protein
LPAKTSNKKSRYTCPSLSRDGGGRAETPLKILSPAGEGFSRNDGNKGFLGVYFVYFGGLYQPNPPLSLKARKVKAKFT